jgi:hypothetical protein
MQLERLRLGRRPGRRLAVVGLGLALMLGPAACGRSSDGAKVATLGGAGGRAGNGNAAGSQKKDPQQAALDFARCMRQHGLDMPDPKVDAQGRVQIQIGPGGGGNRPPDPKKLQAAQQACGNLLSDGGEGPGQMDPKARDAMVAYAKCMRQQGIDMPDPTGDGLVLKKDGGQAAGSDPETPAFKQADRACKHHLVGVTVQGEIGGQP